MLCFFSLRKYSNWTKKGKIIVKYINIISGINIDDLIEQQKEKKDRAGRSRFTKFVDSIKIVNRHKTPLNSTIPLAEQENF